MKFPSNEKLVSVKPIQYGGMFAKTIDRWGNQKAYVFANQNDDEEVLNCQVFSILDEVELIKAWNKVKEEDEEWESDQNER